MAQPVFEDMFNDALERYKKITGKRLQDIGMIPTTEQLIAAVTKQNEQHDAFRNKAKTLTNILKWTVQPFETLGNLAAGAASAAFPPSSMIFGAVKYLIDAAKGVSDSLDAIEKTFEVLKDYTVRLHVYNKSELSSELRGKLTVIMVTLIEILARSTKMVKSGWTTRIKLMSRNVLLGNGTEMQSLLAKLDKLTVTESQLAVAETLVEAKEAGKGVRNIQTSMADQTSRLNRMASSNNQLLDGMANLQSGLAQLTMSKDQSQGQAQGVQVQKMLSPSGTYQERYLQIKQTRLFGSGQWLQEESSMRFWLEQQDEPILWLQGNPGSGKSFLAYKIIDHVHDLTRSGAGGIAEDSSIAYFFFRYNNTATSSVLQALKDLAYQLTTSDPAYLKFAASRLQGTEDVNSIRVTWKRLFVDYWLCGDAHLDQAYLILDGLDEAEDEDREVLFELLADLHDAGDNCRLKVAMTGRPHVYDELTNSLRSMLSIYVDSTKNGADIQRYVVESVNKNSVLSRISSKLRRRVISTLSGKAEGMFVWVNLMIEDLAHKPRASAIEQALDNPPKGLKKMLTRVLEAYSEQLDEDEASDLNDIIAWVCAAKRPLKLGELDAMLRLKSEAGEPVLLLENKLRLQFAALFTLTRDDMLTTADLMAQRALSKSIHGGRGLDDADETISDIDFQTDFDSHPASTHISFAHSSISSFFSESHDLIRARGDDSSFIGIDIQKAYQKVTFTCIDILMYDYSERMEEAIDLEEYAQDNWFSHLRDVDIVHVNPEYFAEMGDKLITAWSYEEHVLKFAGIVSWESFTQDDAESLCRWVKNSYAMQRFEGYEIEWLKGVPLVGPMSLDVFEPAMRELALAWLTEQRDFDQFEVIPVAILMWLSRKAGSSDPDIEPHPSVAAIHKAASWANLEEDSVWYRRMAVTFRHYHHNSQADSYFRHALYLEPDDWEAAAGLAILRQQEKHYLAAVKLDQTVLQGIEKHRLETNDEEYDRWFAEARARAHTRIAENYFFMAREIDDKVILETLELDEKSYEHYQASYAADSNHNALLARFDHLQAVLSLTVPWGTYKDDLLKQQQAKEIMPLDTVGYCEIVIKTIEDLQHSDDGASPWTDFLLAEDMSVRNPYGSVCEVMTVAAQHTDKASWLLEAYRAAIDVGTADRRTVAVGSLRMCLACVMIGFSHDLEDNEAALRILEELAFTSPIPAQFDTEVQVIRALASIVTATLCHELALTYPDRQDEWITKLQTNIESTVRRNPHLAESSFATSAVASVLCKWYSRQGRIHEAKELARPFVKDALQMLSDDDPSNDREAISKLVTMLMNVDEREDATAIGLMLRPYDDGIARLRPMDGDLARTMDLPNLKKKTLHNVEQNTTQLGALDTRQYQTLSPSSAALGANQSINGADGNALVHSPSRIDDDITTGHAFNHLRTTTVDSYTTDNNLAKRRNTEKYFFLDDNDKKKPYGERYFLDDGNVDDKAANDAYQMSPAEDRDYFSRDYTYDDQGYSNWNNPWYKSENNVVEEYFDPDAMWQQKDDANADEDDDSEDDPFSVAWACYGPCRDLYNNYDCANECVLDGDTWCTACLQLLKQDRIPIPTACTKEHEFIQWPCLTQPLKTGEILVGGEVRGFDKWKQDLRKKWRL